MAYPTFNPIVAASPGTTTQVRANVFEADFGDGYSQPTPAGLNHVKRTLTLRWEALRANELRDISSWLERRGGTEPFYYRPYGSLDTFLWTCREWTEGVGQPCTLSATFVRWFGT